MSRVSLSPAIGTEEEKERQAQVQRRSSDTVQSWSRRLDPVFAVSIGITAGLVRIRREERDKRLDVPSGEDQQDVYQRRYQDLQRLDPLPRTVRSSPGDDSAPSVTIRDVLEIGWRYGIPFFFFFPARTRSTVHAPVYQGPFFVSPAGHQVPFSSFHALSLPLPLSLSVCVYFPAPLFPPLAHHSSSLFFPLPFTNKL